ncbi:MarR family winged helix-turn-helix transcriptional regulator [Rhizobium lemnae]
MQGTPTELSANPEFLDLGELGHSLGFLLQMAYKAASEEQSELLKDGDPGVSFNEFIVLKAIALNPGIAQGFLADWYRITWPSMSRLIASMEKRDLVRRVIPPEDRRCVGLCLTPEGECAVVKLSAAVNAANEQVFKHFNADEKNLLATLLRRIVDRHAAGGSDVLPAATTT